MPSFAWLKKTDAVAALESRLSGSQFWTADECWLLLVEALRAWNALTEQWRSDYVIINANGAWINTSTATGSPRLRSVTDVDLYTRMEYMLLEPPSGGTWTGSSQFDLASLQSALQKRTQEVIQATACNLAQLAPIDATPGTRRNLLDDTVLEPRRIRWIPEITNQTMTLTREDTQGFQYFEPDYLQTYLSPRSWSVASEPPLAFDTDTAPNTPGQYDVLALVSGPVFSPPAPSLLGVPDDWSWLPMYGALSDVLGREAEATDRQRAAYCLQRYVEGLGQMRRSNWLVNAAINAIAVDTPALAEADAYFPEWQITGAMLPAVVQAGVDFIAPTPGVDGQSVSLTLVGNAPLLDSTATYVQVSRDDFEAVLNYAQHTAMFKQGGAEFAATVPMLKDFYRAAESVTKRRMTYGFFTDVLNTQGERQEMVVPR